MRSKESTKEFAFSCKLAKDDPDGTIEGYVSVYGNRDKYGEIVMPGAFADSLNRQKREGTYPLMLWQHDISEPIGVWEDLSDDGKGLWGKGRLLVGAHVPTADKVHTLVKNGAVRGMSIGYHEVEVEVPKEPGEAVKLIKLDLMEASIVSFPANRRARVESVKSELEDAWREFARRLSSGDPMPPKEFEALLREAGVSKSMATGIASVGYAKSIRSESGGSEKANETLRRLRAVAESFS